MYRQVVKEFSFDGGHRLAKKYQGKCARPHGHRWQVKVCISGDLDDLGMVLDFNELKFVKEYLDNNFDHKMLLYKNDTFVTDYLEAMYRLGFKDYRDVVYLFDDNPTAEVIAQEIYNFVANQLKKIEFVGLRLDYISVFESPTSEARISYE